MVGNYNQHIMPLCFVCAPAEAEEERKKKKKQEQQAAAAAAAGTEEQEQQQQATPPRSKAGSPRYEHERTAAPYPLIAHP